MILKQITNNEPVFMEAPQNCFLTFRGIFQKLIKTLFGAEVEFFNFEGNF